MNHFQKFCLLLSFLLLLLLLVSTPRIEAARWRSFSSPSGRTHQQLQVFNSSNSADPFTSSHGAREFESQKRRVPTGSNPLHNKRR
ncbi:putative Clavata3/esr-related 20 [Melia azedarach]|uniref:Clavata3/esr-related 20 n=1 Tax=Melia azedarach TaxID=155640 RepID=A0ACC1Z2X7_MELAZ|nr:putative Clavata3/esr-related 20 [Melia azedarach]